MLSSFVQEYYNILFIFQLTTHKEAIIAFNKYSKQIRKQIRKQHEKYYLSYYVLLLRKTFWNICKKKLCKNIVTNDNYIACVIDADRSRYIHHLLYKRNFITWAIGQVYNTVIIYGQPIPGEDI